jgi:DNA repair photolyase
MVIYEPKGAAREYCALCVNLYSGCSHGCSYCYAPSCLRRSRQDFARATPRKDILKNIEKEAPAFAGKEVHLCFTTDPYQPIEAHNHITRKTLQIFNQHNVTARILTKGAKLAARDFDLLKKNGGYFGVTLTYDNAADSLRVEPGASLPQERLAALRMAKEHGIPTWVSFEPVVDPCQALNLICHTLEEGIVDEYKVGKWNHSAEAKNIDWHAFVHQAMALLDSHGAKYYIKNELRKFI